jgi:hypothetical protein
MSLVQGIKKMAQGDVAGGLVHSFTGSIGNEIFEMARGNKSVGQGMAQIGTDVASAAVSFIPGIGPVAGAALKAGLSAANAAAQGGGAKDIALGAITGAASGVGGSLLGKAGSVVKESVSKVTSTLKIGNTIKNVSTGAANATANTADVAVKAAPAATTTTAVKAAPAATTSAASAGYKGTLPDLTARGASIRQAEGINPGQSEATSLKSKVGKVAGQVGVQGVLSVASAIMGAKQASAANEVAKQSLLFQQQTYKEQKAETEKNKAKLKEDAWSDYSSASLFGSNLYGSESNNTLFTNYHVNNGTGNQGNFSILSVVPKNTDLT